MTIDKRIAAMEREYKILAKSHGECERAQNPGGFHFNPYIRLLDAVEASLAILYAEKTNERL